MCDDQSTIPIDLLDRKQILRELNKHIVNHYNYYYIFCIAQTFEYKLFRI